MNNEKALAGLIKITNKTLGYTPNTPSEFNDLIRLIKKKTGQEISLSSLKRLWGYVSYSSSPSPNILNILSRFNDFDDWNDYLQRYGTLGLDETSNFLNDNMVEAEKLKTDTELMVSWDKDKSCRLKYLGDHIFLVEESSNIKLLPGDEFTMHSITIGLPFYAAEIKRGNEILTGYIGAKRTGIKSISME